MSKLIVEMEMPKACPCDLIGVGYDMYCSAVSGIPKRVAEYDECVKNGTRPDWCPICGVLPDEHGDLIDRDELLKECYPDDEFDAHVIYADDIHKAKAVITAERKDDADYQLSVLMQEYFERYEPTYNSEDGSM